MSQVAISTILPSIARSRVGSSAVPIFVGVIVPVVALATTAVGVLH